MKGKIALTIVSHFFMISLLAQDVQVGKTTIDPVGYLKSGPSENSKTLLILPKGDSVMMYGWYEQPYVKVSYKNEIAFISIACLSFNSNVIQLLKTHSKIPVTAGNNSSYVKSRQNINCSNTANCGSSGKNKDQCGGDCCKWVVGSGCKCK